MIVALGGITGWVEAEIKAALTSPEGTGTPMPFSPGGLCPDGQLTISLREIVNESYKKNSYIDCIISTLEKKEELRGGKKTMCQFLHWGAR